MRPLNLRRQYLLKEPEKKEPQKDESEGSEWEQENEQELEIRTATRRRYQWPRPGTLREPLDRPLLPPLSRAA